jgi:two-component system, OmpR family, phosphate regulon sensor histidine kinase PhoR
MLKSLRLQAAVASLLIIATTSVLVFLVTRSTLVEIVAASLAAGALGALGISLVLRPLARIASAARRIAAGELRARVSPRPVGELGDLADAFNQMAQSIEELVATASQERNRLMAALNSSIDAVLAVDRDGKVRFANFAAERMFSRSQRGIVDSPFAWVIPHQEVVDAFNAARAGSGREVRLIERPGRQHMQVICTPILGGGEWSALVVFHDISEVRRAENMRRDFVANVSHELRTPLASIKAVLETLEAGALDDREAARDFIGRADNEIERLVLLVEELLELSRMEAGDLKLAREPVDITRVLEQAVERMRPQAEKLDVRLTLQTEASLPEIEGDETQLERAALNLIHNAIKFTPAGGLVEVSATRDDSQVVVRVKDTGLGIDSADLPRVFERFYKADHSRRSGGTGLGLALVKHAVEAHGGTVKAESEHGHGSTFSFSLPIRAGNLAKPS